MGMVCVCVRGCMYSLREEKREFGGAERRRRGVEDNKHKKKITDQISIELKQTRTREGHYIMYCVDFFFFPY